MTMGMTGGDVIAVQVRRANKNLFLTNAVILLLLAAAAAIASGYYYNFFKGPFPTDKSRLLAPRGGWFGKRYFDTDFGKLLDTGFVYKVTDHGSTTTYNYLAAIVHAGTGEGMQVLLVKAAEPKNGGLATGITQRKGELISIPSDVREKVVEPFLSENPRVRGHMADVMFDASDNFAFGGWAGLVVGVPAAMLCLWNMRKALARMGSPSAHPVYKALAAYGEPQAMARDVDADFAAGSEQVGRVRVGRAWVMASYAMSLRLTRMDDLVWVYKKVVRHYHNGIPTGKTTSAVLRDRRGGSMELTLKGTKLDHLLTTVAQRAPWVIAGFDKRLEQMWMKDRGQLVAIADERRRLLASPPPAEQLGAGAPAPGAPMRGASTKPPPAPATVESMGGLPRQEPAPAPRGQEPEIGL